MKYIDLYNYKNKEVPEEIKAVTLENCKFWDQNYGYSGKKYSENAAFQCQLDTNASLAEDQTFEIINNPTLAAEINEMLKQVGIPQHLSGSYEFNDIRHGEVYVGLTRKTEYTWCDFFRPGAPKNKYDANALWTVETKATKHGKKDPSSFHKGDIVLVFYLDTLEIEVLGAIVPRNQRTDADYIRCGKLSIGINFKPISIDKNWTVTF